MDQLVTHQGKGRGQTSEQPTCALISLKEHDETTLLFLWELTHTPKDLPFPTATQSGRDSPFPHTKHISTSRANPAATPRVAPQEHGQHVPPLQAGCKGEHPLARGDTYDLDVLAGAQAVVEAHPVVVVRVLPVGQHVHVPSIVGPLVGHPGASIHTDGVAAAQVGVEIGAVAVTLVVTAQEVLVFIEGDLK